MLRVGAVPNYNNQTTFNGKFVFTQELHSAKFYATEKEIAKFEQLAEKMQKINDNKAYKLSEMAVTSLSQVNRYLILYCRNMETYKLKQNLIKSIVIPIENKDAAQENIYSDALKNINKILSRRYGAK